MLQLPSVRKLVEDQLKPILDVDVIPDAVFFASQPLVLFRRGKYGVDSDSKINLKTKIGFRSC